MFNNRKGYMGIQKYMDMYVRTAEDYKELKEAEVKLTIPHQFKKALNQTNLLVLNDFEIITVKFLANGLNQDQIEQELKS